MKKITLILAAVLVSIGTFAQYSNKEIKDPIYKDKFNTAEDYIDEERYKEAIEIYEELLQDTPNNDDINFRLGFCYLFTKERWRSLDPLEKVVKNYENDKENKEFPIDAYYVLGYSYYLNYMFDDALDLYDDMKKEVKSKKELKNIEHNIAQCKTAKKIYDDPKMMMVIDLGVINSPFADHSPTVSADESVVIFTSRREGSTGGGVAEDEQYYEDIYVYNKKFGIDSKPKKIDSTLVNSNDHEATCGLNFNGSELYIFKATKKDKGDIFYSKADGDEWSEPKKVEGEVNTRKRESHASISPNGEQLYFTSARKGGYGGMDIYVADWDKENKQWINARNLGPEINTEFDEEGPFINYDDEILYFSSEGHETMGGFDIFKAKKKEDGSFGNVQNMGFPLNTVDDDLFFAPTIKGNRAYYSSQQEGSSNIYIVELYDDPNNIMLVKGFTYDSNIYTKKFSRSDVTFKGDTMIVGTRKIPSDKVIDYYYKDSVLITDRVINNNKISLTDSLCKIPDETIIADYLVEGKRIDNVYTPNDLTGKYMFVIRPGEKHLVYYEAEGHMFDLMYIPKLEPGYHDIFYKAEMDTLIRGQIKQTRKSVPYDAQDDNLSEQQELELELLANFMKKHPYLYVDLSAQSYKQAPTQLGEDRIQTVQNYLLAQGIGQDRILIGLSPNEIGSNEIEYTLYDETTKLIAENEKKDNQIVVPPAEEIVVVFVSNINFEINKFKTTKYNDELNRLADYMKANADASVQLIGYTDTQGPVYYNKQLSKNRANFVKTYLTDKGVDEKQITAEGRGFDRQIAKNKDNSGKYIWDALGYNRRVEIIVTKQGETEKLKVKQIDVPEKYIVEDKKGGATYSINLSESATRKNLAEFEQGTKEFKKVDGSFYYYFGEYSKLNEAQQKLFELRVKYPNAFIFQNN